MDRIHVILRTEKFSVTLLGDIPDTVFSRYEKSVRNASLYSSRSVKIPAPHFIVFYNGLKK